MINSNSDGEGLGVGGEGEEFSTKVCDVSLIYHGISEYQLTLTHQHSLRSNHALN